MDFSILCNLTSDYLWSEIYRNKTKGDTLWSSSSQMRTKLCQSQEPYSREGLERENLLVWLSLTQVCKAIACESCPGWVWQCILPAPGSQFSENWDWGKSFPQELPRNARPGGIDLYPTCQQGRGQGDGSQG